MEVPNPEADGVEGDVLRVDADGEYQLISGESTARLSASVDQSIPDQTWTNVEFDTVDWDSGSLADTSGNQITVDQPGKYYAYAVWNYDQTINDGTRLIAMTEINGTRTKEVADGDIVGGSDFVRVSPGGLMELSAGDSVGILTWHDHGSGLDIMGSSTFFGLARVTGISSGGSGSAGTDVISSPNHNVSFAELENNAALSQPIELNPDETVTVKAWGAHDTGGNTPSGLNVALEAPDGSLVTSANTAWSTSQNGITSYQNTSTSLEIAHLEIRNNTGSQFTDPDGVGGRFGYKVE